MSFKLQDMKMKGVQFGISIFLLAVCMQPLNAQQLRFEITGYDATTVGNAPGYRDLIIMPMHFDANGLRQGRARIYSSGDVYQEKPLFAGTWKDGILVDTAYWYSAYGQLKRRAVFADNKALATELPWKDAKNVGNGTLHGEVTTWNSSRTGSYISMVENYSDGKRSGMLYYYAAEGKLSYQEEYSNGLRNGNYISYFDNGLINAEGAYENDKREGQWNSYYPTGIISQAAIYRKDALEDSIIYYHPNGKRKTCAGFEHGLLRGDYRQYDTLGRIAYYCHYGAFMKRDRIEIYYYPNGREKERCRMADNDRNGTFLKWHENGKLAESGQYKYGRRIGIWSFYNDKGVLLRKHDYDKNPDDVREEMIQIRDVVEEELPDVYIEFLSLPVFKAFRSTVEVPESSRIRFPRKLKLIDLDARVEKDGSVRYSLISDLPDKNEEQLLRWLKLNYSRAEPFNYNGKPQLCTVHFRVYITS